MDYRTSFLANEVAISFDNAYSSREVDYSSIDSLSSQLKEDIGKMNPTATIVLHQALQKFSDREIRYVDDLIMKVSLLSKEMSHARELPKERLGLLRDFCVNLSRISATYYLNLGSRRLVA